MKADKLFKYLCIPLFFISVALNYLEFKYGQWVVLTIGIIISIGLIVLFIILPKNNDTRGEDK
jgi:hypothetical protein